MTSYVLILSVLLNGAPAGGRQLVDRVVAVVNEEIVTLSELESAAKPFLEEASGSTEKRKAVYREVLEQLIADRLISQQIVEAKIVVGDEEIDRAIKDILRQNNIGEADLKQAVESRGMSLGQYREDLRQQLIRLKIVDLKVRSRVQISDTDIQAEFDRLTANDPKEELVSIRHLFFRWGESANAAEKARVLKAANEARQRIVRGEDFAAVAKAVSEGPTAAEGGDLGEVSKKGLLPELARAVESLPVKELSMPIETKNGVHVVRVEARRSKEQSSFAEMRNQIYQRLYTQEVDRQMRIWVDELRAEGAIEVRL